MNKNSSGLRGIGTSGVLLATLILGYAERAIADTSTSSTSAPTIPVVQPLVQPLVQPQSKSTLNSELKPERQPDLKPVGVSERKPNQGVEANQPVQKTLDQPLCGAPVLNALKQHKVIKGETLATIAKKYNLTPATIMGLNPSTRAGFVEPGQTLAVPPLNGMSHQLNNDETYKAIAQKYNVRADVLFERNGCQSKPKVVFVPGAVWKPNPIIARILPAAMREVTIIEAGGYPLPYAVPVTSGYGWRTNPVTKEWAFHSGIDLGAPMGTPVLATKAGRVEFAGWSGGYGNLIELNHNSVGTRYAHLSAIYVNAGQKVAKGQQIGIVGSTGRSTGPHLHFEVLSPSIDGWVTADPAPYLSRLLAFLIQTAIS